MGVLGKERVLRELIPEKKRGNCGTPRSPDFEGWEQAGCYRNHRRGLQEEREICHSTSRDKGDESQGGQGHEHP